MIAGNSDTLLTEVVNLAPCFVIDSDDTMLTPDNTKVEYLNHYEGISISETFCHFDPVTPKTQHIKKG